LSFYCNAKTVYYRDILNGFFIVYYLYCKIKKDFDEYTCPKKEDKNYSTYYRCTKKNYWASYYQFHIPGHTKGYGVYKAFRKLIGKKALLIDTTDEFDNLGTLNPPTVRLTCRRFGG